MNFDESKWDTWRSQFMTFRLVTKLHNQENEVQIASLKYCMGKEAKIMKSFNLTDGQSNNFKFVLKKFEGYFESKVNVIHMRCIFREDYTPPSKMRTVT